MDKTCQQCNQVLKKRPSEGFINWHTRKFCSRSCFFASRRGLSKYNNGICLYCNKQYKRIRVKTLYCDKTCADKGRVGKFTAWNKGKTGYLSETIRQKMSQRRKGRVPWNKGTTGLMPTPWNKGIPATPKELERLRLLAKTRNQSGENHWNWQGGITPENYKIRNSPEYKNWRDRVFIRDNYTCQKCSRKRRPSDRVVLHADHIKPFATHPELRLCVDNGRTLCRECHLNTDTWGGRLQKALYLQKLSIN